MDDVPDQALLALPSIPTALTAFASMNGLALLAEHLPLLFPDITPQESAMTESCAPDNNNITGPLSQNWVNVEISDELCDVSCCLFFSLIAIHMISMLCSAGRLVHSDEILFSMKYFMLNMLLSSVLFTVVDGLPL